MYENKQGYNSNSIISIILWPYAIQYTVGSAPPKIYSGYTTGTEPCFLLKHVVHSLRTGLYYIMTVNSIGKKWTY